MTESVILVTGFEPFGPHALNPSADVAKAVDGRRVGECRVRSLVLPVQHERARMALASAIGDDPLAVVHLGLAAGRARIALERVAVNVLDYSLPDADGARIQGEPCVPDGPAAYLSTLPLLALERALAQDGIPAYVSNTAGTYLCNHTLYWTRHEVERTGRRARAGFIHLPSLPAMVAASGLDEPSMDLGVMLRAMDVVLGVLALDRS
jgi:pyroglutamyl-peptidase